MTRPVVIDVIAKDDASATFRKIAAEQAALGKATDQTSKSFTQSSQNLRKSQLSLIAAQERYNKVATDGKASVGQLASAQSSLISAQQRVGKATDDAAAAHRRLNKEFDDTKKKAAEVNRGMGALVTTALALGPALVPIGVVGAGALAGLVPAAGAAGLALLGLRDAWKAGTLQGSQFGKTIKDFQGEFDKLKTVSANAIAPGLNKAARELEAVFPALNQSIGLAASQMGHIAANVAPGLVRIFTQLQPLFQTFGDLLVQGSQKFAQWAASTGSIKTFVAYVQTQLPVVMSTITNLVTTVGHLVAGFAPFGSTSLLAIKLLSQALNAIPIGVLQAAVPLIAGFALGLKAFKAADAAATSLGGLSTKLGEAGGIAKGASGVVGVLGKAVGFLGPVGIAAGVALGGLSLIMGSNAKAAQEQARRVTDLTEALQAGAVQQAIVTQLQSQGATQGATAYGITLNTLLGVVNKNTLAQATYQAQISAAKEKVAELAAAQTDASQAADPHAFIQAQEAYRAGVHDLENLENGVKNTAKALADARVKVSEFATAQGDAALGSDILAGKAAVSAKALGLTEDAYIAGKIAADKHTASIQANHDAMVVAGDAAGLLKEALDKLNGVQLTLEGTNIAFHQSLLTLTEDLKTNGRTINLNTAAGLSNRQNILSSIQAAKDQAVAVEGGTQATAVNTATYRNNIKAILDHIAQANGDKTATDRQKDSVYQLVLQLSGYNKLPVPPKPISVPTADAMKKLGELQDKILGLVGKTVVVELDLRSGVSTGGGGTAIGGHPAATGGYIYGPGTKTSDSVPILASAGEFMVRADAVSKYGLGFMRNLNAMKFAAGGPIVVSMPNPAIVASQASTAESSAANAWARNNMAALASQFGGAGGPATVGGNLGAWIAAALAVTGTSADWAGAIQRRIMFESGGNPNAINLWDSNAMAGDPSRGLMQTIGSTFNAYHQAGTSGNIYDPVANIAAAINYIKSRYGSIFAIDPPVQGYRNGGMVDRTGLAFLHRGEEVLPSQAAGHRGVVVAPGAITVYAAAGMDAREVARQAFVELRRWVADEERKAAKGGRA